MSKIQSILFLFIFLLVIVSMGLMFSVKESFIMNTGEGPMGQKLKVPMNAKPSKYNGNIGYESMQYVGLAYPPCKYMVRSEDQPLSYGFPSIH